MPSPFEKKHIPKEFDKRRKLSDEDKEEIQYRYLKIGGVSQRELAREYGVSRRLIVFIIYPERQIENYKARVDRGGSAIYYEKSKHTEYMRTHREHKNKLYKEGKLIDE
jgi:transposase-like protein